MKCSCCGANLMPSGRSHLPVSIDPFFRFVVVCPNYGFIMNLAQLKEETLGYEESEAGDEF